MVLCHDLKLIFVIFDKAVVKNLDILKKKKILKYKKKEKNEQKYINNKKNKVKN